MSSSEFQSKLPALREIFPEVAEYLRHGRAEDYEWNALYKHLRPLLRTDARWFEFMHFHVRKKYGFR
jgi:hypothetical protein